jgi:hypothetical protein
MRYHLESTLPIHAFNPLGGRHSPFKHGMTLEGGGGGGIIGGIGDAIGGIAEGIGDALAGVDKAVGDVVPGGWGTIAAIAVPYAAPMITGAALTAGQAAALAAGTRAATGAIRGEDTEDILKGAATAGLTSYGLNSLFGDAGYVPDEGSPYINGVPPDSYVPPDMDLNAPYIDAPDGETLLTPDSAYTPDTVPDFDADVTASAQPPVDVIPPELDLGSLYRDLPDGATELGYSPEVLASSAQPTLSPEEELRRMYEANINDLGAGTSPYGEANELPSVNESAKDPFRNPSTNFLENPKDYLADKSLQLQFKAEDTLDYLKNAPENAYKYLRDTPIKEMGSDLYDFAGRNKLELGLGALALSSMGGQQPQQEGQPVAIDSRYTGGYGSSGGVASPYLLRNRVTASNIYDYENPYNRYGITNRRYAKGGEVKHFAFGGISNALTKITQPIEKAIIRPVGQALPFLKDVAPYAGILAAPFIANPAMAVGVGALSSGFGRPGTGFDMKRALMGGIAAYGASTLGAGIEAAGTEPTKPLVDTLAESYAVPGTEVPASTVTPKGFFRDTDAMQRGVGNLLSSDSDAATKAFGTKASIFKSGVPIVMGTSGMMAIDEANKMREEAELAAGPARQSQADMLARISKGKKRAEQAVRENPYMYAAGGLTGALGTVSTDGGSVAPPTNNPVVPVPMPQQPGDLPIQNIPKDVSNNPLPPGFVPPSGPSTSALVDFFNPKTGQKVTVGSGGYTPPAGFYNVTGLNPDKYPTETVRPPDASTGYRPPFIPPNQYLLKNRLSNIYSRMPARPQPRPMGGLSSLIQRPRFMPRRTFAMGGQVDDELGGDYSAMGMDQGNMQKGLFGMGYAAGGMPNLALSRLSQPAFNEGAVGGIPQFAGGGTPRFLSGGGDGMSDSIPATIEGTQEARLADGEFVIPADVVSHLGNGSSKAGAKQLYSMMDRVRKARTGNEKQGRQIKPNKMMPA